MNIQGTQCKHIPMSQTIKAMHLLHWEYHLGGSTKKGRPKLNRRAALVSAKRCTSTHCSQAGKKGVKEETTTQAGSMQH